MSQRSTPLPQTEGGVFLTDAGLETVLIFHQGIDLPCFAAFPLVDNEAGREAFRTATTTTFPGSRSRARHGLRPQLADLAGEPGLGRQLGYDAETLAKSTAARSSCWSVCAATPARGSRS